MASAQVDILVLGAGWLWYFLLPELEWRGLRYAATTRDGRHDTISWTLDETSKIEILPSAKTVVVTFPVLEWATLDKLVATYEREKGTCWWVLLGSTRGWKTGGSGVISRRTPLPHDAPARSVVEDRFLDKCGHRATVLNLAGLHGRGDGTIAPRIVPNFLKRVAPSKEALKAKDSLHLVHGTDAALAIVLVHEQRTALVGRYLVTDGQVYDWWSIGLEVGGDEVKRWVLELMSEVGIRVLPRAAESLGRVIDGSEFWVDAGAVPRHAGACCSQN